VSVGAEVTWNGIDHLKKALQKCKITTQQFHGLDRGGTGVFWLPPPLNELALRPMRMRPKGTGQDRRGSSCPKARSKSWRCGSRRSPERARSREKLASDLRPNGSLIVCAQSPPST
jgi:hypothetical protein